MGPQPSEEMVKEAIDFVYKHGDTNDDGQLSFEEVWSLIETGAEHWADGDDDKLAACDAWLEEHHDALEDGFAAAAGEDDLLNRKEAKGVIVRLYHYLLENEAPGI